MIWITEDQRKKLDAAPLRFGNRGEYAHVVALFQDTDGGSLRQDAGLLVYG